MANLVYILLIALFFVDSFLLKMIPMGGKLKFSLEMLSALFLIAGIFYFTTHRVFAISPKYIFLSFIAILHIFAGIVLNSVAPEVIFSAIRSYFKWSILFFIPAIFHFSEEQLTKQLKLLLALALMQVPITLFQRLVQYRHLGDKAGDLITGTLGGSGVLSLLLLSTITILIGFYTKKHLSLRSVLIISILLVIPTTINETKISIVLLPIIMIMPLLMTPGGQLSFGQRIGIVTFCAIFFVGFISIYDHFYGGEDKSVVDKLSIDQASKYLYKGARKEKGKDYSAQIELERSRQGPIVKIPPKLIPRKDVPRGDSMMIPLRVLSDDPLRLWFGVGAGNASPSTIQMLEGEHAPSVGEIVGSTGLSFLLWELGIGGVMLFIMFLLLVLWDTFKVSRMDTLQGSLAVGWITVIGVMFIALFYVGFFRVNILIYLFVYFSGIIAAERWWMNKKAKNHYYRFSAQASTNSGDTKPDLSIPHERKNPRIR